MIYHDITILNGCYRVTYNGGAPPCTAPGFWGSLMITEVNDLKFLRQRSLLLRLLQLVEKAVYIEAGGTATLRRKMNMVLGWNT